MKYFYDTEFLEQGPGEPIVAISIGMVSEDGRELYAIYEGGFEACERSPWLQENVLPHLQEAAIMSRPAIAQAILEFVGDADKPELWAYYADYDHVVLCQTFGSMIDLPAGWPMYTMDLKQWCDGLGNPKLPAQSGDEHHALADARWNRQAWEFLNGYMEKIVQEWEAYVREGRQ